MNMINFTADYNRNIPLDMQKRLESQENFGAVDTEKLKQDTAEFAKKTTDEVKKENFIFRTLRNFGVSDPKKLLKSIGLTIVTTVGLALLGNKMSTKTADWGIKVDKFLKKQNWYSNISQKAGNIKSAIVGFLKKSKTIEDISNTLKTKMAKPKSDMTRGYGRGFVSIFSLTPVDTLKKMINNLTSERVKNVLAKKAGIDAKTAAKLAKKIAGKTSEEEIHKILDTANIDKKIDIDKLCKGISAIKSKTATYSLQKLVGQESAGKFADQLISGKIADNRVFCTDLSNAIREKFNAGEDNKKFIEVLKKLKTGKIDKLNAKEFTNVTMKESGLTDFFVGNWVAGKGNLGDSLIKFNAVNGTLADTAVGKLIQKSVTIPTESISNFVNDKSKLGLFLTLNTIGTFNNMQEAPKGKKVATVADDFMGTIGSIAIATPLAFKTTYGLATLSKLEGKGIISRALRTVGKFFHMGLGDWSKHKFIGSLAGKIGGATRFALIMFVFSSIFQKPIKKVIHKIFGKPYNKAEEEQKQLMEQQQNAVIPELGITNKELMEKIQANPKAFEKLQTNPLLAQEVANNPKLLLDLLDGKDVQPKNLEMSPANKKYIQNKDNINTSAELFKKKQPKEQNATVTTDTATYIPSSENIAPDTTLNEMQLNELNQSLSRADKILKKAEGLL